MFRTILVPLDGSHSSEAALPALYEVAVDRASVSVRLLQVVVPPGVPVTPAAGTHVTMFPVDRALNQATAAAGRYLFRIRHQLLVDGFSEVDTTVLVGDPQGRIIEAAAECSLVVMATSGRSGIARAVRGSVTDYVVRNTPHSAVLVVRPEPEVSVPGDWVLVVPPS